MITKRTLISYLITLFLLTAGIAPSVSYAANNTTAPASSGGLQCSVLPSSVCSQSGSSDGVLTLLKWVLNIVTVLVGIAAVGALIFAGVMYSSAGGDTGQVAKAKTMITNTVIGIIAYGLIFLVLKWLLPGGVLG